MARARELGLTVLLLGARGGTGAAEFYERSGWTECGRVERSLRVDRADGRTEWRDDISMVLRLDGGGGIGGNPVDPVGADR